MSDRFYDSLVALGRPAFWVSSRPTVIDDHFTDRPGAFILAANHTSPYDIPVLMRHCRRRVDFVSSTDVFARRLPAWLYGRMNAFPLDRTRADAKTVRIILDRLARGRVVGMFPEGGFRRGNASVVHSRQIRPGIGRLAVLANVPIVPCVIVGAEAYGRVTSWLPLRGVRYAVAFGAAIEPAGSSGEAVEQSLVDALVTLYRRVATVLRRVG